MHGFAQAGKQFFTKNNGTDRFPGLALQHFKFVEVFLCLERFPCGKPVLKDFLVTKDIVISQLGVPQNSPPKPP